MIKVSVWTVCLFSALTVGTKSLSKTGRVGENVTFYCSDWEGFLWHDVQSYDKYICNDPCKDDKDVIMRVKPGETQQKDRIYLYSNGGTLSVTFTDLQKSDSKSYNCGLERFFKDSKIKLNLEVIDAVTSPPKTTVRTVSVWSNSTVSSSSSNITSDISTLFTTLQSTASAASQTHGDYSRVIYLTTGFTFIITTLLLLLCLMMKMKKGRKKSTTPNITHSFPVFSEVLKPGSPETVIQQDVDYAEITHEDHAERSPAGVHMETLYANCSSHQDTDCIYSVAQTPEEQPEPNKQTVTNDPESSTVYSIYCLAEQTQAK